MVSRVGVSPLTAGERVAWAWECIQAYLTMVHRSKTFWNGIRAFSFWKHSGSRSMFQSVQCLMNIALFTISRCRTHRTKEWWRDVKGWPMVTKRTRIKTRSFYLCFPLKIIYANFTQEEMSNQAPGYNPSKILNNLSTRRTCIITEN